LIYAKEMTLKNESVTPKVALLNLSNVIGMS